MIDWIVLNVRPMEAAFVAVLGVLVVLIWKMVSDPAYANFKCIYMVCNAEGYPDNDKLWLWGAFIISSYGFLHLLWHEKLSEAYFIGYMTIWAASKAYAMKKRAEGDRVQTTATIETPAKATVKTDAPAPDEEALAARRPL